MATQEAVSVRRSSAAGIEPRRRRREANVGRFLLLAAVALFFLFPLYWMVTTALKTTGDSVSIPIQWWPQNPTLAIIGETTG